MAYGKNRLMVDMYKLVIVLPVGTNIDIPKDCVFYFIGKLYGIKAPSLLLVHSRTYLPSDTVMLAGAVSLPATSWVDYVAIMA